MDFGYTPRPAADPTGSIFHMILESMVSSLNPARAAVLYGEPGLLRVKAAHGLGPGTRGPHGALLERIGQTLSAAAMRGPGLTIMGVPYLNAKGGLAGILYVEEDRDHGLGQQDRMVLEGLCRQFEELLNSKIASQQTSLLEQLGLLAGPDSEDEISNTAELNDLLADLPMIKLQPNQAEPEKVASLRDLVANSVGATSSPFRDDGSTDSLSPEEFAELMANHAIRTEAPQAETPQLAIDRDAPTEPASLDELKAALVQHPIAIESEPAPPDELEPTNEDEQEIVLEVEPEDPDPADVEPESRQQSEEAESPERGRLVERRSGERRGIGARQLSRDTTRSGIGLFHALEAMEASQKEPMSAGEQARERLAGRYQALKFQTERLEKTPGQAERRADEPAENQDSESREDPEADESPGQGSVGEASTGEAEPGPPPPALDPTPEQEEQEEQQGWGQKLRRFISRSLGTESRSPLPPGLVLVEISGTLDVDVDPEADEEVVEILLTLPDRGQQILLELPPEERHYTYCAAYPQNEVPQQLKIEFRKYGFEPVAMPEVRLSRGPHGLRAEVDEVYLVPIGKPSDLPEEIPDFWGD